MKQSNRTTNPGWALALPRLIILAFLALAGCSGLPQAIDSDLGAVERENAAAYLDLAQANLDSGQQLRAALILIELRKTRGLVPEDLQRADRLLNVAAGKLFEAAQAEGSDSAGMRRLYNLEFPPRLRATAGLRMAEQLFEEGHPVLSYRAVTDVERKLPNHPMRSLAAEVLARTGEYMLAKGGTYNWLFSYKVKGAAALEFMVERYAGSEHCARAYALLASYYESLGNDGLALERWENLIIYHGDDALVPEASSRLPYLRMKRMGRNDYDRTELLRAKQEIERWLSFYPNRDQAPWMQVNLADCHDRLALNDLSVAKFYVKVNSPTGARLHADRALIEANLAREGFVDSLSSQTGAGGDADPAALEDKLERSERTIASIESLLARLPAQAAADFGVEAISPGDAAPAQQAGTQ